MVLTFQQNRRLRALCARAPSVRACVRDQYGSSVKSVARAESTKPISLLVVDAVNHCAPLSCNQQHTTDSYWHMCGFHSLLLLSAHVKYVR